MIGYGGILELNYGVNPPEIIPEKKLKGDYLGWNWTVGRIINEIF